MCSGCVDARGMELALHTPVSTLDWALNPEVGCLRRAEKGALATRLELLLALGRAARPGVRRREELEDGHPLGHPRVRLAALG